MQLQVFITGETDRIPDILSGLMESGISGTTIVECEGGLQLLAQSEAEKVPAFGMLRRFLNPSVQRNKMLITVLQDEQVAVDRRVILNNIGDISLPEKGILFTIPVGSPEGLAEQQ